MAEAGQRLQSVLGKYANFLRERKLALPQHQSHLVLWVREFPLFAREHGFQFVGSWAQSFVHEGRGYGQIRDPRTGRRVGLFGASRRHRDPNRR